MKHVAVLLIVVLAASAVCCADPSANKPSRGQAWIESHPFTINALIETPFNADVHKELGFTSVFGIHTHNNPKLSDTVFSTAAANNMQWHMFSKWEHQLDKEEYLESIKKYRQTYKGNIGISVGDECDPKYYEQLAPVIDEVRKIAPDALIYHALRGIDFGGQGYEKPGVYEAYVDKAIRELKPDVVMFDMYPFYRKGLAEHFFRNLEIVTSKARKANIPCMNWLQGHAFQETPKWPHHAPSESEINFQAYVSLAYGCKGLSYWTYGSHYFPYGASITNPAGNIAPIGQNVKKAIPKLRVLGEMLKFMNTDDVLYVPAAVQRDGKWHRHIPLGVKTFSSKNGKYVANVRASNARWGFLLSYFEDKQGNEYLMVVNCNHGYKKTSQETQGTVTIEFAPEVKAVEKLNLETGQFEKVALRHRILNKHDMKGGTGDLFRIITPETKATTAATPKYNHEDFWKNQPEKAPAQQSPEKAATTKAGKIGTLMVVGNSIAWHPPRADIGWKGNWGMAATSQDKDYAHQLHKHLCKHQPDPEPKLDVQNYIVRSLTTNPKLTKQITSSKADVVVIQIGDNIAAKDATEKNVTLPLISFVRELKKTNPTAKVFIASTYGDSPKVDSLLKKAQVQSKSHWISLKGIIHDARNRAGSEGHFTHSGVNWHPGDHGMKTIADTMWRQMKSKL